MPLLKDVYCGRGGWTKGFMAQGFECVGYDLNPQPNYPARFIQKNALDMTLDDLMDADFLVASSPCENFSVHCMKHFHKNPPHPELGIKLFNHTRDLFERSGKPYIMENVRCAERFVGQSVNHCGPFYLWGNAVPAVMPKHLYQVQKGMNMGDNLYFGGSQELLRKHSLAEVREMRRAERKKYRLLATSSKSKERKELTAKAAEIPLELSEYVAKCAVQLIENNAPVRLEKPSVDASSFGFMAAQTAEGANDVKEWNHHGTRPRVKE